METVTGAQTIRVHKGLDMPSVPMVLMKILRLVDDNRASARRLEELILHDPSLSARILKLANSAFYSFRCEVKTISHAIALLGLNLVKSLAIGVSIFESFTKGLREEGHNITELWMHSFGVGLLSQEVQARRAGRSDAEFSFLCGLLHDLGEIVLFKENPRQYSQVFALGKCEPGVDICVRENERFGVTHATMGSMLAKHWGLPPELATVARYHHDPLSVRNPLVCAVALGDSLAKLAGIGYDGDNNLHPDLGQIREEVQLGAEEWESLSRLAQDKKKEVEEFFLASS
jgi:HD-like signal output (HDOD) protein